ncbi:unnamed protein product [Anisakis simplex]|uniref:C2H2-type domain-containing protein n=1 Tax=Anisakis simplex TaxID=6269 RepID=A0A0M3K2R1_ANISI|nr:unnamed protein product [Anisakis simplex]
MEGQTGVKRARSDEDPRLAPFEGLLRARGVTGIPCETLLQVLTILQIIPADLRFEDYIWATWQVMARHAGPLSGARIREMERTGVIPDKVLDALCRMEEVLLVVHPLKSGAPVRAYGKPGKKVVEAAECCGSYAVLDVPAVTPPATATIKYGRTLNRPIPAHGRKRHASEPTFTPLPTINEEEEPLPGPSSRPDFPAGPAITSSPTTNTAAADNNSLLTITSNSPSTSHDSTNSPAHCTYNFRHPRREASPLTIRLNPRFEAANISNLPTQHAAELVNTIPAPYKVVNNKVFCQLSGCARRATPFSTVAAWKIHVRRAKCHETNSTLRNIFYIFKIDRHLFTLGLFPYSELFSVLYMVRAHRHRARGPLGEANNNTHGRTPRREVCGGAEEGGGREDGYRRAPPGARPRYILYRGPWSDLGGGSWSGRRKEAKENHVTEQLTIVGSNNIV